MNPAEIVDAVAAVFLAEEEESPTPPLRHDLPQLLSQMEQHFHTHHARAIQERFGVPDHELKGDARKCGLATLFCYYPKDVMAARGRFTPPYQAEFDDMLEWLDDMLEEGRDLDGYDISEGLSDWIGISVGSLYVSYISSEVRLNLETLILASPAL